MARTSPKRVDRSIAQLRIRDPCNKNDFCLFGNFDRNVYLVGDSHTDTLAFNLKERLNLINYNFINMSAPAGIYGRNRIIDGIDTNKLDKRREIVLNKIKDSTVIFGGWIHREKDWFFNDTATTEIYTILFVGSVRCV